MNPQSLVSPEKPSNIFVKFLLWPILFLIVMLLFFWAIISSPEASPSGESAAGVFIMILLWLFIMTGGWIGAIITSVVGSKRLSLTLSQRQNKIAGRTIIAAAWLSLLVIMIISDMFFKDSDLSWSALAPSTAWMFLAVPAIICGSILGRHAKRMSATNNPVDPRPM